MPLIEGQPEAGRPFFKRTLDPIVFHIRDQPLRLYFLTDVTAIIKMDVNTLRTRQLVLLSSGRI